jgi:DNA-binding MarR family transcriptional regulator
MTRVKEFPEEELQVPLLMGLMFRQVHEAFDGEDWGGLRQSHFRVISGVPPEGISVTDLGEWLHMTKQGCGQFVTQLEESGHLRTEADPRDRRVRRVHRTPQGDDTIAAVTARILRIEEGWAEVVGDRRYRTFRGVLQELALRD